MNDPLLQILLSIAPLLRKLNGQEIFVHPFLIAAAAILFTCALTGNTRALRAGAYGVGIFIGFFIVLVVSLQSSDLGWGAIIIFIIPCGLAVFIFIGNIFTNALQKTPTSSVTPISRVVAALLGGGSLVLSFLVANSYDLADWGSRRAVLQGDTALLEQSWNILGQHDRVIWEALAEREPGRETLKMMAFMIEGGRGYFDKAMETLARQPRCPERFALVKPLFSRLEDGVTAEDLVRFHEQEDMETLSFLTGNLRRSLSSLTGAKRYDVARTVIQLALARAAGHKPDSATLDAGNALPPLPPEVRGDIVIYQYFGDKKLFAELLVSGADPDVGNDYGETALMRAVNRSDNEACQLLLAAGADVEIRDRRGRTALFYTVIYNEEELFSILLGRCTNFTQSDVGGLSLLHWAAWIGNADMVKKILAAGVPADAQTPGHQPTPLFYAVQGGGPLVLNVLLNASKTDGKEMVNRENEKGSSPLRMAIGGATLYNPLSIPDLGRISGLGGRRPLHLSGATNNSLTDWLTLQTRKRGVTAILLNARADVSRTLKNGNTLFHLLFELDNRAEIIAFSRFDDKEELQEELERQYRETLNTFLTINGGVPAWVAGQSAEVVCENVSLSKKKHCQAVFEGWLNKREESAASTQ